AQQASAVNQEGDVADQAFGVKDFGHELFLHVDDEQADVAGRHLRGVRHGESLAVADPSIPGCYLPLGKPSRNLAGRLRRSGSRSPHYVFFHSLFDTASNRGENPPYAVRHSRIFSPVHGRGVGDTSDGVRARGPTWRTSNMFWSRLGRRQRGPSPR